MKEKIKQIFNESIEAKKRAAESIIPDVEKAAQIIIRTIKNNKKILICGNGGSAADAQHFAAELVVRYEKDRRAYPAIALTTDSSILTACSNDIGFESVFKRQVEALGNEGDVLVAITTSGNSPNIIKAVEEARKKQMKIICLLGKDGGKLKGMGDVDIIVPSNTTARIQEVHETIIHAICSLIEEGC